MSAANHPGPVARYPRSDLVNRDDDPGKNLDQFDSDMMLRMATERFLAIVCEASRRLPDDIKKLEAAIKWQKMVNFGNVLRHTYHATRVDIVWDIVQNDLPVLKAFVVRNIARDRAVVVSPDNDCDH